MIKSLIIFRPAGATGRKEEPVHEDPGAVVVGVIGQEPVPLVLLLTRTVTPTPGRGLLAAEDYIRHAGHV